MKRILIPIILIALSATSCYAQWKFAGNIDPVGAFGVHDTNLFIYSYGNSGVPAYLARYTPWGAHVWTEADSGIDFSQGNINSFASLGQYFFAGCGSPETGIGFVTTNNGESWTEPVGGPIGSNGTYIFGQYATRIARSRDSGKTSTWEHLSAPAGYNYVGFTSYVFTNTPSNGVWRSTDSGGTWAQLSTPFAGTMTKMGSLLFIFQPIDQYHNGGNVILSSDGGMHWDTVRVDSAGLQEQVTFLVSDGKHLFAAGVNSVTHYGNGVYLSVDTGKTWIAENQGLTYLNVRALGVFDTVLFVNTPGNGGLYYTGMRSIPEMTDTTPASVVQSLPLSDSIEVYPNPAAGNVTILSGGTSILGVSVLNVLGEEMLDLPNLRESEITLDMSKLASGTYFLRIETESGSILRKIVKEE